MLRSVCAPCGMGIDRTAEFQAAVSSLAARSSKSPAESRHLLSGQYTNGYIPHVTPKSEFSRIAAKIGHDINSTGAKLQKLAQCMIPFIDPKSQPFHIRGGTAPYSFVGGRCPGFSRSVRFDVTTKRNRENVRRRKSRGQCLSSFFEYLILRLFCGD